MYFVCKNGSLIINSLTCKDDSWHEAIWNKRRECEREHFLCVCSCVRVYVCARGWVVCANAHSLSNTRIQSHVRLMQSKYTMNSHLSDGFDCIKSTDGWTCRRHKKYIQICNHSSKPTDKKPPYTCRDWTNDRHTLIYQTNQQKYNNY